MATEQTPTPATSDPNASDSKAAQPSPAKKRKRRRWPFVLLALVVLLVALVGSAPFIASTRAGTSFILGFANNAVPGTINLEKLSLSWFGDCGLDNLNIKDPAGRDVIAVKNVRVKKGLLGLATGYQNFEAVEIANADVTLYLDKDGNISLVDTFVAAEAEKEQPESAGKLPELVGRLVLTGSLQVIRPDGTRLDIPAIQADVNLSTLDAITAKLRAELANKQGITADVELQDLLADGKLDPLKATGKFAVKSDGDITIDPVTTFLSPDSKTTGQLNVDVKGTMTAGEIDATLATAAKNLKSQAAGGKMQPLNLSLNGKVKSDGKQYDGNLTLEGDAGRASTMFAYTAPEDPNALSADYLSAAVLSGKQIAMPNFNVAGDGEIDLAKIARVLPGLFNMPADQQISGGTLKITTLKASGGDAPAAAVNVTLETLTAGSGETRRTIGPASIDIATKLVQGTGLEIEQATIKTKSTQIVAAGNANDMRVTLNGDLAGLSRELGAAGAEAPADLAGNVNGEITMKRTGEDRIDLTADLTGTDFVIGTGKERNAITRAVLNSATRLELADGALKRVVSDETKVDLDGKFVATAKGDFSADSGGLNANVSLAPTDLAYLGAQSPGLGITGLASYGGRLTMTAQASRESAEKPIKTSGNLSAANITLDGKPADTGDVKLEWSDVAFDPAASTLRIGVAKLESALAKADASGFNVAFGETLALAGHVKADADLAGCLATAARVAEWKEAPKIAGRLNFESDCKTDGGKVEIKGTGKIPDLRIGEGAEPQALDFTVDSTLDSAAGNLDVRRLRLASAPLTLEIAGDVRDYARSATLNLDGNYEIAWQPLTALIHELAPDTKQTVIIKGKSASRIAVRGDARAGEKESAIGDLQTGLDVSWDAAQLYGVDVGKATLSPKLADGILTLPVASIPASGGTLRLGGNVDLRGDEPVLHIKDELMMLEKVPLNKTVADVLLAVFNPIFANVTEISGHGSLRVKGIEMPLGDSRKYAGAGSGRLEMIEVKMKPAGFLGQLVMLGGLAEDLYAVEVSGLDFKINEGRIHYKDFTLLFAQSYDMKFYGSVGLDGTLDLVVSLPIRPALLQKLKIPGPAEQLAQTLEGLRVDIPIAGTRANPKLDFSKVDVSAILKKATSPDALGNVLKNLGGG